MIIIKLENCINKKSINNDKCLCADKNDVVNGRC